MQYRTDLYELLEIPEFSSIPTIKKAYHKLAKKYHPDINPKTGHLFAELTDTYKLLINPKFKIQYDEFLTQHNIINTLHNTTNTIKQNTDTINKYNKQYQYNSTYYSSSKYYTNPINESILTIIQDFPKYRFENAYMAIFNRNLFVLLSTIILLILILPCSLYTTLSKKPVDHQPTDIHIINNMYTLINNKHTILITLWIFILTSMSFLKLIYIFLKAIYWFFKNIYRYFLIPNAIKSRYK